MPADDLIAPGEGEQVPAEGDPVDIPLDGDPAELPAEGELPVEGEMPVGEDPLAEGEVPVEGEMPIEGEPPGFEEPPEEAELPVDTPPIVENTGPGIIGPIGGMSTVAYVQFNDSPFASIDFSSGYFFLEDFEDGVLENPGASASAGGFTSDTTLDFHDSVDADDGQIDGNSLDGDSWFRGGGRPRIRWNFNAGNLNGNLPTHAGLVFTDGRGTITFEAFGPNGESLGTSTGNHADNRFDGATAEDRFYGVINEAGVSSIRISTDNEGFGLEIDHLQWGFVGP